MGYLTVVGLMSQGDLNLMCSKASEFMLVNFVFNPKMIFS